MELSFHQDNATLLKYDEYFAGNGQLKNGFKACASAFGSSPVEKDRFFRLITALVEFQTVQCQEELRQRKESLRRSSVDPFVCVCCDSLFHQPITLACGHTFCRGCFEEECTSGTLTTCKRCNCVSNANFSSVNVLLSNLIQKLFQNEYQTAAKIVQGKKLLENKEPRHAIDIFDKALQNSCQNIDALCWRSDAFFRLDLWDLALRDINAAFRLQPQLCRIVQRKAKILARMGNLEESAIAFVHCLLIEPTNYSHHEETAMVLSNLFSPLYKNSLSNLRQLFEGNMPSLDDENTYTTLKFFDFEKIYVTSGSPEINDAIGQQTETRQKLVVDTKSVTMKEELQCKLCLDILLYPVTTACGHTFCRDCLKRTLDHRVDCPCCRAPMDYFLGEKGPAVNEVLELATKIYCSAEYTERKSCYDKEITSLGR